MIKRREPSFGDRKSMLELKRGDEEYTYIRGEDRKLALALNIVQLTGWCHVCGELLLDCPRNYVRV